MKKLNIFDITHWGDSTSDSYEKSTVPCQLFDEIIVKDYNGHRIYEGDHVWYPTGKNSNLRMNTAVVLEILDENTLKCRKFDSNKIIVITRPDRCIRDWR